MTRACEVCSHPIQKGRCAYCDIYNAAVAGIQAAAQELAEMRFPDATGAWLNEYGIFAYVDGVTQQVGTPQEAQAFAELPTRACAAAAAAGIQTKVDTGRASCATCQRVYRHHRQAHQGLVCVEHRYGPAGAPLEMPTIEEAFDGTLPEPVAYEYDDGAVRGVRLRRQDCRAEIEPGVPGGVLPDRCVTPLVGRDHLERALAEIERLRTVIKTGGAMYRLERASMGIPGGIDPHDALGTPEPFQLLTEPWFWGVYDQDGVLHACNTEKERAHATSEVWSKQPTGFNFQVFPLCAPRVLPAAYVTVDERGERHGVYDTPGEAQHGANKRRSQGMEWCHVVPVFVVTPPGVTAGKRIGAALSSPNLEVGKRA